MSIVICKEVRQVTGGFIVEVRWPYGGEPTGFGEVVCKTWPEVIELLSRAAPTKSETEGTTTTGEVRW